MMEILSPNNDYLQNLRLPYVIKLAFKASMAFKNVIVRVLRFCYSLKNAPFFWPFSQKPRVGKRSWQAASSTTKTTSKCRDGSLASQRRSLMFFPSLHSLLVGLQCSMMLMTLSCFGLFQPKRDFRQQKVCCLMQR